MEGQEPVMVKNNYQNFIIFLKEIVINHKDFIQDKSLSLLYCYIRGLMKAVGNDIDNLGVYEFDQLFQSYIESKYNCKLSKSWCNILRFYADGEEEAFILFHKELYLFEEGSIKIRNMLDKNKDIIFYDNMNRVDKKIEMPLYESLKYKELYYQKLWKELMTIKMYPELILGEKSLTLIKTYTDGFTKGFNMISTSNNIYNFYPEFVDWLQMKTGIYIKRPWHKYILLLSQNEEKAFDIFYDYLSKYMEGS